VGVLVDTFCRIPLSFSPFSAVEISVVLPAQDLYGWVTTLKLASPIVTLLEMVVCCRLVLPGGSVVSSASPRHF